MVVVKISNGSLGRYHRTCTQRSQAVGLYDIRTETTTAKIIRYSSPYHNQQQCYEALTTTTRLRLYKLVMTATTALQATVTARSAVAKRELGLLKTRQVTPPRYQQLNAETAEYMILATKMKFYRHRNLKATNKQTSKRSHPPQRLHAKKCTRFLPALQDASTESCRSSRHQLQTPICWI